MTEATCAFFIIKYIVEGYKSSYPQLMCRKGLHQSLHDCWHGGESTAPHCSSPYWHSQRILPVLSPNRTRSPANPQTHIGPHPWVLTVRVAKLILTISSLLNHLPGSHHYRLAYWNKTQTCTAHNEFLMVIIVNS